MDKKINKYVGLPDLTINIDIDPKVALERKGDENVEKFENVKFLDQVRELYLTRAKEEGYEVVSSDDIIEFVQEKIQKIVMKRLRNTDE